MTLAYDAAQRPDNHDHHIGSTAKAPARRNRHRRLPDLETERDATLDRLVAHYDAVKRKPLVIGMGKVKKRRLGFKLRK